MQRYKLGEVCEILGGTTIKASETRDSGIPVLNIENIQNNKVDDSNVSYVDPNLLLKNPKRKIAYEDIIIAKTGDTSGKIGINLTNKEFLYRDSLFKLTPNPELDKKYLFHFLLNSKKEIKQILTGATRPQLNKSSLEQLIIILPPLEEQKRIAMILDQFMELERELVMRKKQYEYYRDLLIQRSLKDPESKEYGLGEICKIVGGIAFKPSEYTSEGMPIVNVKNIQEDKIQTKKLVYCNPKNYPKAIPVRPGDVVIAGWGDQSGKVGMNTTDIEFFNAGSVFNLFPDENVLDKKYLYHFLLNSKREINELIKPGDVDHLYKSSLAQLKIIVPPMEIQKNIASILDKFSDAGISGELEKEISLRHDQYEYYRDHLISI